MRKIGSPILLIISVLVSISLSCQKQSGFSGYSIENLSCEHQSNPLGIDQLHPQLSWMIISDERGQKQTAYHILVASSEKKLKNNTGDLWDSGKVPSGQSVLINYKGKPLESGDQCYWKVMIWDKDQKPSKWSEPGFWTMGLLNSDDWQAQWISTAEEHTSPFYRHSFTLDEKPDQALIYVASLGYFELFVNGEKVGTEVLAPAVSNFSKRTYYQTFDLSRLLRQGENYLGIWMGTGWYTQGLPGVKHHSPVIRAQLELDDDGKKQILVSDTSWETKPSNRERLGKWAWGNFGGEVVDSRAFDTNWWHKEKSKSGWGTAIEVDVEDVICSAQPCRGNIGFETLTPQTIEQLDAETILVDFGTNLTGLMEMTFHNLKSSQKVSMYYADLDGRDENERWRVSMAKKNFATYNQWDEFISAGAEKEYFNNRFNYHAFRYVLIEGLGYLPDKADIKAVCIETQVDETGDFTCSNELFNSIHQMVKWTYRCLNLGGQTVDCPHRERLGYGDGQTIMDLGLYNFNTVSLYSKWSQNWWDEQGPNGFVPFTAPCPHDTGGGPAWGAMCIIVPWKNYQFSGDIRLLRDGYPFMKKYLEYLDSHCENNILQDIFPGEKWPNLGDWVPPRRGMDKQEWVDDNSRRFFNNCYRIYLLQVMQEVAALLEHSEDLESFIEAASTAQKKVHEIWYNPQDSSYANGEQPYLIFPLKTGVTTENLRDAVFEKFEKTLLIKDQGHLNTGMIGTQIMTDYLLEIGRNDLIDVFVNKRTYPGWGYMIEKGATTCWEQWNGYYSQIHSCFPYIGGWFYKGLAGIQWDPKNPGFKNVILQPGLVKSVNWVECSYESPYGEIISNWKANTDLFEWQIAIPPNSTAIVHIPGKDIRESGKGLDMTEHMTFLRQDGNFSVYEVQSGTYLITSKLNKL